MKKKLGNVMHVAASQCYVRYAVALELELESINLNFTRNISATKLTVERNSTYISSKNCHKTWKVNKVLMVGPPRQRTYRYFW